MHPYDGLFRREEVIGLRIEDLDVQKEGDGLILLRRSKTDQEGEGDLRYLRPETIIWIRRWLARVRRAERDRLPESELGRAGGKTVLTGALFVGCVGRAPSAPNRSMRIRWC